MEEHLGMHRLGLGDQLQAASTPWAHQLAEDFSEFTACTDSGKALAETMGDQPLLSLFRPGPLNEDFLLIDFREYRAAFWHHATAPPGHKAATAWLEERETEEIDEEGVGQQTFFCDFMFEHGGNGWR